MLIAYNLNIWIAAANSKNLITTQKTLLIYPNIVWSDLMPGLPTRLAEALLTKQ